MLHYDTRGTGPTTLLLLHGFLGSGRNLMSLARRLSESRPELTVVLPDLRGHGSSPGLDAESTLTTLAQDVLELSQSLSPQGPCELVGHSLGGRVALCASHLAPAYWRKTTLLDIGPTPFGILSGAMQRIFERLMGAPAVCSDRAAMKAFFIEGQVPGPLADWVLTNLVVGGEGRFQWRIDRAQLAQFHWNEAEVDLWPLVPPLAAQLEVIYGGASAFVSPAMREQLRAAGVPVTELPGASHFVHVDALEPLVAALTRSPASSL